MDTLTSCPRGVGNSMVGSLNVSLSLSLFTIRITLILLLLLLLYTIVYSHTTRVEDLE